MVAGEKCLFGQQAAISQKEIVFRFRKDVQSERAGVWSLVREKSRCEGDLCWCSALYHADSLSCQSLGFLVEAWYSTEPIVEKKEL